MLHAPLNIIGKKAVICITLISRRDTAQLIFGKQYTCSKNTGKIMRYN